MKYLHIALIIGCLGCNASSETPKNKKIQMGTHVSLGQSDASGFVRFIDQIDGYEVVALSLDVGSAVPSADLRLYVKLNNEYKKIVSLPLLTQKGYLCIRNNDSLQIFTTTSCEEKQPPIDQKPVMSIDLKQIVEMVEEY